ncbi:MAG: hypothetical protein H7Y03_00760 [Chitinophagaceae bacterium]|nr:hypothetical protein [Chitinophagaceae bacterium]
MFRLYEGLGGSLHATNNQPPTIHVMNADAAQVNYYKDKASIPLSETIAVR